MGYGKEPLNLLAATVEAGDGNPYSLTSAVHTLERDYGPALKVSFRTGLLHGQSLVQTFHTALHRLPKLNAFYNDHSEGLRYSPFSLVIGWLGFLENFVPAPLLGGSKKADALLVTQEMQLLPFVTRRHLLTKWFPSPHRYLLIPDVLPKVSAIRLLQQLNGLVAPVVWNQTAFDLLKKENVQNIVSASPWIINSEELNNPHFHQFPTILYKSSGSSTTQATLDQVSAFRQTHFPNTRLILIRGRQIIVDDQGINFTLKLTSRNYRYQLAANPHLLAILSPASEMIMLQAQRRSLGLVNQHFTTETYGSHEEANLAWATKYGFSAKLSLNSANQNSPDLKILGSAPLPRALNLS